MALVRKLPRAFLFDMDGLLLDTERMFLQAFLELTAPLGIANAQADAFFRDLVGTSAQVTTARLDAFLPGSVDRATFDQDWRTLHAANVEKGVPVKAYAVEVLTAIQYLNVPMAVVTSTRAAPAKHHLEHAGLNGYFKTICAGDEVSANKPDPAPYLEAADRLGVPASDCIAFEDSDLGTTAATRAGCRTFQIPDLRPLGKPLPDLGQAISTDLRDAADQIGLFDPTLTNAVQF